MRPVRLRWRLWSSAFRTGMPLPLSRYGSALVAHESLSGRVMSPAERRAYEDEYARLCAELVKVGLEPTISASVLDVFTDGELKALVKDAALRLIRFRRMEGEL